VFGEIAAIVSALKGVQSVLAQLSDAKASYDQASTMLGKLGDAQDLLDTREKKLKLRKPLTSKQSMEIIQKQAEISAAKQRVRDHLLMSGHGDMLKKQEKMMSESRAAHQVWMKGVALRRKKRRQDIQQITTAAFIVFALTTLAGSGVFFYQVHLEQSLKTKKQLILEKRERVKNYRHCGRAKC
tara:strand:- start:775 stop:1326 length:552 start_codon:yes stop_codon:yes gene_type:complete